MVSAQQWLDKKYPKYRRSETTELDINKGEVKKWFIHDSTLKGHLKLNGFTELRILNCFGHELTKLDLSECKNLRELNCSNNKLSSLIINNCFKLEKINCVGNNYLEEIGIENCTKLTDIGSGFTRDTENNRLVKGSLVTYAKENDIRNILVIGWAGNGKSTLANVLSNETDKFSESAGGIGQTISFKKSDLFQWKGKKYCIVDNIGFGDNNFPSEADILHRVGEGIYSAKEGLNQVLFVFSGRFSEEQIVAFNLFKNFVNETGITKFTTLVRTNFQDFREQQVCEEDRKKLLNQSKILSEIINSCNGIVYVDNPAIPIIKPEDSEKKRKRKEQEIVIYKEDREGSRKIVLDHLAENCQEIYKLKEWDNIYSLVVNYMKKKQELEQGVYSMKEEKINKEWSEVNKEIKFRLEADPLTCKAAIEIGYSLRKIK